MQDQDQDQDTDIVPSEIIDTKGPAGVAPISLEVDAITLDLSPLSRAEATLFELLETHAEAGVDASDVNDTQAIKLAKAGRKDLREARLAIDETRKAVKAPALEWGRQVDAEARRLTAIIEPREAELASGIKEVEEAKREAKRLAELAASRELDRRMELLRRVESDLPVSQIKDLDSGDFDHVYAQECEAFNERQAEKQRQAEERAAKEEEERLKEKARREAEDAERERKAEEARLEAEAEQKRQDKGRAAREAKEAEAREEAEAKEREAQRLRDEAATKKLEEEALARQEAEKKAADAERDRVAAEKRASEAQAKLDAIEDEKRRAREAEEAKAAKEAEALRLEEARPVVDQIENFANLVESLTIPEALRSLPIISGEIQGILDQASQEVRSFAHDLKDGKVGLS